MPEAAFLIRLFIILTDKSVNKMRIQKWSNPFLIPVAGLVALTVLSAGVAACARQATSADKLSVVVSILPLADFVAAVGGDKVNVSVMVPTGAEPHTYEPTPSQMVEVSKAKMFVKVGSGVEFELTWMDKLADLNRQMLVVDSSEGVQIVDRDPHIWTSPANATTMVNNICEGLVRIDPNNRHYYEANRNAYLKRLGDLHNEIRDEIALSGVKEFMVFHPAWAYFARDYGMEEISIEAGRGEPSAADIARLIEEAKSKGIKVVFVEPQFNRQSAEVIARAIGGTVIPIDPLARNYIDNLRTVVRELVKSGR